MPALHLLSQRNLETWEVGPAVGTVQQRQRGLGSGRHCGTEELRATPALLLTCASSPTNRIRKQTLNSASGWVKESSIVNVTPVRIFQDEFS